MVSTWKQASRDLRILISCSFLMSLGFYSLIPRLALHFTNDCGWSMTLAGFLLATRQFGQQGLTFAGGALSDRFGWKRTMVLGVLIRSVGFASFAFAKTPGPAFAAAALSGLGGALFDPSYKTAFDQMTEGHDRPTLIAFREVATNIALACAGLVGVALAGLSFGVVCVLAGSAYLAVAAGVTLGLRGRGHERVRRAPILHDMARVASHRSFVAYTLLLTGYYYLATQLYLSIPEAVLSSTHDERMVTALYTVIAGTVIALQLRMSRWTRRYPRRFELIGLGTLVLGMALLALGLATGPREVLLSGVVFACGTMIAGPIAVEVIPRFAREGSVGAYYGFNGYALAFGGAGSAAMSGWLFDVGAEIGLPQLPWIAAAAVASSTCAGLWLFERATESRVP